MLNTVIAIAYEAGNVLRDMLYAHPRVWEKAPGDLLTDADMAANDLIVSHLQEQFPHSHIWSEEGEQPPLSDQPLWLIDPLDGTTNFAHRHPSFAVSIGLVEDGYPTLGVVYDPIRDHLFAAARGQGATMNNAPLHVSDVTDLSRSLAACDWTRGPQRAALLSLVQRVGGLSHAFRVMGVAALSIAYVAAGWLDGYFNAQLHPWDFAAALVILEEAGGIITDWEGRPLTVGVHPVVCGNPALHSVLLEMTRETRMVT